jgi:Rieske Fe-S protein
MIKRRHFLTMMGATVATGVAGCSGDDGTASGAGIPAAGTNVRDVAIGSVGSVTGRILLGRDAGGLYAMTSVCTHNQCDLTLYGALNGSGITCKCHGSGFSLNGDRVKGPATASLKHFLVKVAADGAITVDTASEVDAAARTAVPS